MGRGGRGGRGGARGHGCGGGWREKEWDAVTELVRLVSVGHIMSLQEMYIFYLRI
eukprot:EC688246.1.p2 GENE.EC688246.1~~EC688246.1.p2  ORF type:complete len:55 (+),score=16.75 EC688246.1:2-166(+)